ncbi:MAG: hypothetical protein FJW24_03955 [Acidimicrobiia bacterium]|nr:hypothetical protein [Acidimicrobiia bacterium]
MAKFDALVKQSIVHLYQWSLTSSEAEFDEKLISFLLDIGPGMCSQIFSALLEDKMIQQVSYEPMSYVITRTLIRAAEEILEAELAESKMAPASDRIVTLDDNKPARQKAVTAIQEVIAEAEKSNEFGQLFADPNERIVVLSEMKSGLAILRDEAVARYSTIKNFIADRLAMIASKIPDAVVGVLAKKAIDALEAFIKGLFS